MRDSIPGPILGLILGLVGFVGCTNDPEPDVVRELVTLDAPPPPKNPLSGAATPPQLNKARFLRYRWSAPSTPVRAVVICVPGMPAGAMAFDELARRLVTLSQGEVEVWAVDRRANLLEDLTGMQAAEAAADPGLAWRYYDDGETIDGKRFAGLPDELDFISEWGLATFAADLDAVVAQVPQTRQRTNVVLLGHSFGAALVQAYAAWEQEGKAAGESLAGLVLLDGGIHLYSPINEASYLKGGTSTTKGLEALRQGQGLYLNYYGFGLEAFLTVEITAMSAWLTPRKEIRNLHTDRFATLLFLEQPPRMTAAAMVGFTLDDASSPLPGMRASCGGPDGPVESFTHPLTGETRWRPSQSDRLYDWIDHDQVSPPEKTSIQVLARVAHEGPTNRLEWFLPSRLALDVHAVRSLTVGPNDWQWGYGLRGRNGTMEAPVLAVMAGRGLVQNPTPLSSYRAALPPVGASRPRAGAGRDDATLGAGGFSELLLPDYAHDDLVHANAYEAERELYQPLLDWVLSNTSGVVEVPGA